MRTQWLSLPMLLLSLSVAGYCDSNPSAMTAQAGTTDSPDLSANSPHPELRMDYGQASSPFSHPPAWTATALQATQYLGLIDVCTGFFISNTGYLLTASHCLTGSIPQNLVVSFNGQGDLAGYHGFQIKSESRGTQLPNGSLHELNALLGSQNPELVISGSGYVDQFPDDDSGTEKATDAEIQEFHEYQQDFSILKFDPPASGFKCLSAEENPASSGLAYAFGESLFSGIDSSWSWAEPALHASFGEFLSFDDPGLAEVEGAEKRLTDATWVGFASAPVSPGMSGGPVIDSDGKVVGVSVYGETADSETRLEKAGIDQSVGYVRVSSIRQLVADTLGASKASEIFSCH